MPIRSSKRPPADPNQAAAWIVGLATGDPAPAAPPPPLALPSPPEKNPAAVTLGRLGGLKGGKARAASLSKRKRAEIAKKAARARWGAAKQSLTAKK